MERFWKYKIDHWIFWITTVFFHVLTRTSLIAKAGFGQFLLEILVRDGLLALLIYGNLLILVPAYFSKGKYLWHIILLAGMLCGYVLLKDVHDIYLYDYVLGDSRTFLSNSVYNFSIGLFYLMFSIALHLSREWYFQRLLLRKVEIEKLNTELEYLKAQVNPHFLFNSINTIYFQIDKQNTQARDTLSRFSAMLRYQLYECNGREISIEKEVEYLKNFVALQRMRTDENYVITFTSDVGGGFSIAPLLLIPFVENAFKHVSHIPDSENRIDVTMAKENGFFVFTVFNTREEKVDKSDRKEGGIGLKNVKRRLELLYNGNHQLDVRETPTTFNVKLQLRII